MADGKKGRLACRLASSDRLSIAELLSSPKIDPSSIPYYQEVYEDVLGGKDDWPVTRKVKEYAGYLMQRPESVADLPPVQFVDGKLHDGAHRISTLYLLSKLHPNSPWPKAKLKVDFYEAASGS